MLVLITTLKKDKIVEDEHILNKSNDLFKKIGLRQITLTINNK